jgi:hypothetical protein
MGPFVRREMVTRRLLAQYVCIRWTNLLSVRSKFHWHEGVILFYAQKYTCTIRLNTDAYLRRVIARRNLRPALHAARRGRGRATSRDDVVGARLVARIARIRTRHTAGAHAPMNTPNEHPHGCHTSADPIPSSLAAAAHA